MLQEINHELYKEISLPQRILLGPGPSIVDPKILKAMSTPLVGHLDPEFVKMMDRTKELLRYAFQTKNELTLPVSGTGSASMEAAVANMIESGTRVLICINGYFGERLAEMARRYGGAVTTIRKPWGEVFDPKEIESAINSYKPEVVGLVHAETSTGAMQPLEEISNIVHKNGAILIVDAVTSLAGVPLRVDQTNIDVCYSGTQKCLSAPPCLGPITLNQKAVERIKDRTTPVTSWYLDLSLVQNYWGQERTYHHTAPISSCYAIYEALRIVAEEGLENRWQRHQANAEYFWNGLEEIGLKCLVPLEYRLPSLITIQVPAGVDEVAIRQKLLSEYNIEIAGGLGELKGKIWRVGLMGYSSKKEYILLLLAALKTLLPKTIRY